MGDDHQSKVRSFGKSIKRFVNIEETSLWAQDMLQFRRRPPTYGADSGTENKTKPNIGKRTVSLLFLLGICAGIVNGLTIWASESLSQSQAALLDESRNIGIGLASYLGTTAALVLATVWICKYFSKRATGSGLPEFKAILSGDMKGGDTTRFFSVRVFIAKVTGLILATGSSLSIGSEGPLIHISACIAHFLMRNISDFNDILDSPSLTKQILAASAAVGVSSAFNAPVGGLLFSVEITSTFYLISNYYKSFIAAMAGSFACNLFLITQHNAAQGSIVILNMTASDNPYTKWELVIFLVMGVGFGYFAHYYLELNQYVGTIMKPYCKMRPMVFGFVVAMVTCLVIFGIGAYNANGMRVISLTSDVFTSGELAEMQRVLPGHPLLGLVISAISRCFLTIIATNLPIPAGIFVPNFLIGGIVGRFVGHLVRSSLAGYAVAGSIHLPGYALVGSTAFAAGVTHTISVAVIAVEMTGDISMLLPCLIVAVISAGIAKSKGLSIYDRGLINKGLGSLQLLLRESNDFKTAGSIMYEDVVFISARKVTALQLICLLDEESVLTQFPVVEDATTRKLIGTISRVEIYEYLRQLFVENKLTTLCVSLLPGDSMEYERKRLREASRAEAKRRRHKFIRTMMMQTCNDCMNVVLVNRGQSQSQSQQQSGQSGRSGIRRSQRSYVDEHGSLFDSMKQAGTGNKNTGGSNVTGVTGNNIAVGRVVAAAGNKYDQLSGHIEDKPAVCNIVMQSSSSRSGGKEMNLDDSIFGFGDDESCSYHRTSTTTPNEERNKASLPILHEEEDLPKLSNSKSSIPIKDVVVGRPVKAIRSRSYSPSKPPKGPAPVSRSLLLHGGSSGSLVFSGGNCAISKDDDDDDDDGIVLPPPPPLMRRVVSLQSGASNGGYGLGYRYGNTTRNRALSAVSNISASSRGGGGGGRGGGGMRRHAFYHHTTPSHIGNNHSISGGNDIASMILEWREPRQEGGDNVDTDALDASVIGIAAILGGANYGNTGDPHESLDQDHNHRHGSMGLKVVPPHMQHSDDRDAPLSPLEENRDERILSEKPPPLRYTRAFSESSFMGEDESDGIDLSLTSITRLFSTADGPSLVSSLALPGTDWLGGILFRPPPARLDHDDVPPQSPNPRHPRPDTGSTGTAGYPPTVTAPATVGRGRSATDTAPVENTGNILKQPSESERIATPRNQRSYTVESSHSDFPGRSGLRGFFRARNASSASASDHHVAPSVAAKHYSLPTLGRSPGAVAGVGCYIDNAAASAAATGSATGSASGGLHSLRGPRARTIEHNPSNEMIYSPVSRHSISAPSSAGMPHTPGLEESGPGHQSRHLQSPSTGPTSKAASSSSSSSASSSPAPGVFPLEVIDRSRTDSSISGHIAYDPSKLALRPPENGGVKLVQSLFDGDDSPRTPLKAPPLLAVDDNNNIRMFMQRPPSTVVGALPSPSKYVDVAIPPTVVVPGKDSSVSEGNGDVISYSEAGVAHPLVPGGHQKNSEDAQVMNHLAGAPRRMAEKAPSHKPPAPKQQQQPPYSSACSVTLVSSPSAQSHVSHFLVQTTSATVNPSAATGTTSAATSSTRQLPSTKRPQRRYSGLWTAVNSATETFLSTIGEAPDVEELVGPAAFNKHTKSPLTLTEAISAARISKELPSKLPGAATTRRQRAQSITDELIRMSPFRLNKINKNKKKVPRDVNSRASNGKHTLASAAVGGPPSSERSLGCLKSCSSVHGGSNCGCNEQDFFGYTSSASATCGGTAATRNTDEDQRSPEDEEDEEEEEEEGDEHQQQEEHDRHVRGHGQGEDHSQDDNSAFLAILNEELDLRSTAGLTLTAYPFSVTENTPMEHIFVLFEMVKLTYIYVLSDGQLKGVIERQRVLERMRQQK